MSDLIETLASYAPALIKRRLAIDPTPISTPTFQRFPAAVLFADISGFTALTEQLARRGPVGAEELTELLNTYFSQLIDLITAHGGDIVKFAGDALIALWPALDPTGAGDPAQLQTVTRRATQCSLIVQEQLNEYRVAPGIRLSLRLSLGAGEILTAHLGGGYGRWEFLVTGDPIVQVGAAGECARPGDVVLSPAVWTLVEAFSTGTPIVPDARPKKLKTVPPSNLAQPILNDLQTTTEANRPPVLLNSIREPLPPEPIPVPTLPSEAEDGLRAYIPGAILTRLAAGQGGWLAELRRITIIFINLPDLDYTLSPGQGQGIMETLQTILYRYEGSINKLSVDDKGVTLIAALGLPPLAHEDDATRALQAALDIHKKLGQKKVRSAIGVTTGRAFCGSVGNSTRREYTMIGDMVNLAARLMQAAPNNILCNEATYQAAKADLDFDILDPIKVKGKAEPVPVYHPLGRKATIAHQQTAMVDRTGERVQLAKRLQTLLRGIGSIVLIEGEAGIGKSRLLAEILRQAETLNVKSLRGAGNAIDKSTPYYAWRSVFMQLFDFDLLPDDPAERRAEILARLETKFGSGADEMTLFKTADPLSPVPVADPEADDVIDGSDGPDWLRLAPLLKAVLPLEWPENEITQQMTGKVRADNIHALLLYLLQQTIRTASATGSRYILILEDAHWLDSASWQLALLIAQRVQPLLLVIVTRPMTDPVPAEYEQLKQIAAAGLLVLNSLPPTDTVELVCQRLGVASLPEPLAELIYTKSAGNPFFGEELAYALRDKGIISVTNGQCHLAPEATDLRKLYLPDTVQGVITSRIDQLTPAQQLTLKVASVIGRSFELDTLHHIHPIEADKAHLPDYLHSLGQLDITELTKREPNLAYIFKQMMTQEVAYNMMLFSQRRELHHEVAAWYEQNYQDEDLAPYYAQLAYHWSMAEHAPKAIAYLEKAGEQALHNYANGEAVEFFSQALEWDARHSAASASGQPQQPAGEQDPHDSEYHLSPAVRRAWWELKLGEAYINWAKLSDGREHLERGLTLLNHAIPSAKMRQITALMAQILQQVWHRLKGTAGRRRVPAQDPILLEAARAFEGLTAVYYFANETILSIYAAFRSLNLAEEAGPSPELARGYASAGVLVSFIPLHRLAQSYCRRALEMAHAFDNLPAEAWVALLAGVYYAGIGHWNQAAALLGAGLDLAERLGDQSRWADAVGNLGMVAYFQAQFAPSAKLFDDLAAAAEHHNDVHNQAWAIRGQIYTLLPLGRFDEALTLLARLRDLITGHHIVDEALNIDLYGLLAVVHLRRSEPEQALAAAERAGDMIAQISPTSYLSLPGYAGIAETYLTIWESQDYANYPAFNQTLAKRACKVLNRFAGVFPIGQPQANLWQGRLAWLSGRTGRAKRLWAKSLKTAEQLQMPYAQALAHYEIGRHLPPDHPQRTLHLTQASKIFTRLEASYNVAQVEAALK